MKVTGRPLTPFTEQDMRMIKDYLESDMGYFEVADKYKVPYTTLQYKVNKYCKINNVTRLSQKGITRRRRPKKKISLTTPKQAGKKKSVKSERKKRTSAD
jgi:hypothetical protein